MHPRNPANACCLDGLLLYAPHGMTAALACKIGPCSTEGHRIHVEMYRTGMQGCIASLPRPCSSQQHSSAHADERVWGRRARRAAKQGGRRAWNGADQRRAEQPRQLSIRCQSRAPVYLTLKCTVLLCVDAPGSSLPLESHLCDLSKGSACMPQTAQSLCWEAHFSAAYRLSLPCA